MTVALALALSPLIMLTACLAAELFMGLRPLASIQARWPESATAVIIVPANNEASILGPRLVALKAAASQCSAQLLVVADNCTDSTAEIARAAGVRVMERHEPDRRGKGFALDFGRRALRENPPDVVLVIDADCATDAQSIKRLVAACLMTERPCQAINLQTAPADAPPSVQLSVFAFYVKNVVRQRALQRLAKQVHLLGTGMALPWKAFSMATLATDEIVEDLTLGLELAASGYQPILVEGAAVWSESETQTKLLMQRRRWESGFIANALRSGPRMLTASLKRRNLGDMWAAIDVMIPPLALLVGLDVIAILAAGLVAWNTGAAPWPPLLLASVLVAAAIGLVLAWITGGSRFISVRGLASVPLYVLWKLPLYGSLARNRGAKEWIRTRGTDHD